MHLRRLFMHCRHQPRPTRRTEDTRTEIDGLPPPPVATLSGGTFDDAGATTVESSSAARRRLLASRYAIERPLSGGREVFAAKDKVLRRNWSRAALLRDRFEQTPLSLAAVEHAGVVRVLDALRGQLNHSVGQVAAAKTISIVEGALGRAPEKAFSAANELWQALRDALRLLPSTGERDDSARGGRRRTMPALAFVIWLIVMLAVALLGFYLALQSCVARKLALRATALPVREAI
jgi:hypothetical protein